MFTGFLNNIVEVFSHQLSLLKKSSDVICSCAFLLSKYSEAYSLLVSAFMM